MRPEWCVPAGNVAGGWGSIGFDVCFTAVSVLGAYEFMRAISRSESGVNCKISYPQHAITMAFCAMSVPLYALVEMAMEGGLLAISCAFTAYVMFLAATSVFDHKKARLKAQSTVCSVCSIVACFPHFYRQSTTWGRTLWRRFSLCLWFLF